MKHQQTSPTAEHSQPSSDLPCDECGCFGTLEIAGRNLCPDCIATAGCGCAGHGEDSDG